MAGVAESASGWRGKTNGCVENPETGYPHSVYGASFYTKWSDGKPLGYLALDSMPKELLGVESPYILHAEIVNREPMVAVDAEDLPSGGSVIRLKPDAWSKEREINAGYRMIAKAAVGSVEYALAESPKSHFFVTWERTPGNDKPGERNYYWGHYHDDDRGKAIADFCARVSEKCEEIEQERKPSIRKQLSEKPPEKEPPAVKPRNKGAR